MVLYFTATWCGPCKTFKPVVQQVDSELGIGITYVDVDASKDLAQRYNITSVPTIVVVSGDTAVFRKSGVMSKPELSKVLSQFR